MSSETKNKILSLFRKDNSVSSAKCNIKFELYLDEGEYYKIPSVFQVQYLYNKELSYTYIY